MTGPSDSMLHGANAIYLEEMLRRYRDDPSSVDPSWREFFEGEGRVYAGGPTPAAGPHFKPRSIFSPGGGNGHADFGEPGHGGTRVARLVEGKLTAATATASALAQAGPNADILAAQLRIGQLIDAYRAFGHLKAQLDPLGFFKREKPAELSPEAWGFTQEDLSHRFSTVGLHGPQQMALGELVDFLEETYARTIGVEFMHINDSAVQDFFQERCERTRNRCELDRDTQMFMLRKLYAAEAFEQFLHVKFRGKKRFSLEGAETLISTMALLVEETARRGVREIVIGMPHRGRLNMLVNILGKRYGAVFHEFKDVEAENLLGRGDVKYHLGFSSDIVTRYGDDVHLSLTFNPSHLEAINPVVEGRVRAKQDRFGDTERERVLPVLLHGDAAFTGQGVVVETLNLMSLDGYSTGGTIHIVVNNQIGFTTVPEEGRSTRYCTDFAKGADIPIFHVNGEDPEAVAQAVRIAAEFRQRFQRDVIIDMYCFRRYGHNEADEPSFTQPVMYRAISNHPQVHSVYASRLRERGTLSDEEMDEIMRRTQEKLEAELADMDGVPDDAFRGVWADYVGGPEEQAPEADTSISQEMLERVVEGMTHIPDDFEANPKIKRLLKKRRAVLEGEPMDWGTAETIAYGSLVLEGHRVRISGQDSQRGTFSHRHAVLRDQRNGAAYAPLANLADDQAIFEVYNSPLSEAGVLGFEFGYSLDYPDALVVWEAQFGDFANGAQVIIDQFISATEDKWNRIAGLTMLLPHGFEGQGPEHSSARLERFLLLCAEDAIQVVNATTPAQMFHLLRRQVVRRWRKPLIVMTPKSLLRLKAAASTIDELTSGGFQPVIGERLLDDPKKARRAVLCSGKLYYDLLARRDETEDASTALLRLEQLYPFPGEAIDAALEELGDLDEVVWAQEEPENMGAYLFLFPRLTRLLADRFSLRWVTREASASPATGSAKAHKIEQERLLDAVFDTGAD